MSRVLGLDAVQGEWVEGRTRHGSHARVRMEERTREDPLAGRLLERITTPCRREELVVRRCATCESRQSKERAGEHSG